MKWIKKLENTSTVVALLISATVTSILLMAIRGYMYYGGLIETPADKELYALLQTLNSVSSSAIVFIIVFMAIYRSVGDKNVD